MPPRPDSGAIAVPLGAIPPGLAPAFAVKVRRVLERMTASGFSPKVFQGLRTDQEQAEAFAHGYSKAFDAAHSWHGYGLAVDIADAQYGWQAAPLFWKCLANSVRWAGLTTGADFTSFRDVAHCQWAAPNMGKSPASSDRALRLLGLTRVWQRYGAMTVEPDARPGPPSVA